MHFVLDGAAIPQVKDIDAGRQLADSIDAVFALFQSGRISRQIDIDERLQTLKVKALGGGVGGDQQA